MKQSPTKVNTSADTRWSYANVWEPKAMEGGRPAWSVSLIMKKTDPCIPKIKDAIRAAYDEGTAILKGTGKSIPSFESIESPLRDGDIKRPDDPAYAGCYFLNAKNYQRGPEIIDVNNQEILDHSEVYSGVYGKASISFFCFNKNGNRGIGCSLHNLKKYRDGEPLGSYSRAEDDFAEEDDDLLS